MKYESTCFFVLSNGLVKGNIYRKNPFLMGNWWFPVDFPWNPSIASFKWRMCIKTREAAAAGVKQSRLEPWQDLLQLNQVRIPVIARHSHMVFSINVDTPKSDILDWDFPFSTIQFGAPSMETTIWILFVQWILHSHYIRTFFSDLNRVRSPHLLDGKSSHSCGWTITSQFWLVTIH